MTVRAPASTEGDARGRVALGRGARYVSVTRKRPPALRLAEHCATPGPVAPRL